MKPWIPHPGASAPLSRKAQLRLAKPLKVKLATGAGETTQMPPISEDSHMLIVGRFVKSSKKMCGVPPASMTRSENCVFTREPLTSAGAENGCPGPGECDSRIADWKAGTVALPSTQKPDA